VPRFYSPSVFDLFLYVLPLSVDILLIGDSEAAPFLHASVLATISVRSVSCLSFIYFSIYSVICCYTDEFAYDSTIPFTSQSVSCRPPQGPQLLQPLVLSQCFHRQVCSACSPIPPQRRPPSVSAPFLCLTAVHRQRTFSSTASSKRPSKIPLSPNK